MGRKQTRGRKYLYFCFAGLIFLSLSGCATIETSFEKLRIGTKPQEQTDQRLIEPQEEANQHLLRGRELFVQGDFERALNENQEVLFLALHQPPEDEALFNIGMIYADPENPMRDRAKSLQFFDRVVKGYPQSLWARQAKAWIGMLRQNERLSQRIDQLNHQCLEQLNLQSEQLQQEKKKLEDEREAHQPFLYTRALLSQGKYEEALKETEKILAASPRHPLEDEALFQMGLIYSQPGNPKRDYGKSINYFKKLMKDYPQSSWSELAKAWSGMFQENDRLNQTIEKLNQTIEKLNQTIEKSKQVDIEIEEKRREKGK
ncbi:MAG TPA: tetratricopeptide repeat protein [Thermodesulfobacteriota bacterium]|nr:tetratricopeptide repeat protein [Thermodesulfobacteriota bacterium]